MSTVPGHGNPDDGSADADIVRIGTAEREDATRALGEHFAQGRLEIDEYESRVSAALTAATRADMRPLFADLPEPHPYFLRPPPAFTAQPPPYAMAPMPMPYHPAQYVQPVLPPSHKSKVVAGVLQIVLPFGVGRFYTGHVGMAIAQLLVTMFTFGIGAIWPVIDGILLLANGGPDSQGRTLRD